MNENLSALLHVFGNFGENKIPDFKSNLVHTADRHLSTKYRPHQVRNTNYTQLCHTPLYDMTQLSTVVYSGRRESCHNELAYQIRFHRPNANLPAEENTGCSSIATVLDCADQCITP